MPGTIDSSGQNDWVQQLTDWVNGTPLGVWGSGVPQVFSWTGTSGTPTTITYSFNVPSQDNLTFDTAPARQQLWGSFSNPQAIQETTSEITQFQNVLNEISAVTNVTFVYSDSNPMINISTATLSGGDIGGITFPNIDNSQVDHADIYLSPSIFSGTLTFSGQNNSAGIFLHEVLHALGLSHAGNQGNSSQDQLINQITYSALDTAMVTGAPALGSQAVTPMALDIAALQFLYGANTTTNSGNTAYTWNTDGSVSVTDSQHGSSTIGGLGQNICIYDSGGINSFSESSSAPSNVTEIIDLRSGVVPIGDQFRIAGTACDSEITLPGSQFENYLTFAFPRTGTGVNGAILPGDGPITTATAGPGPTAMYGNNEGDTLIGGGGSDVLVGAAGNDTLIGNGGNDILMAGNGTNQIAIGGASDNAGGGTPDQNGQDTYIVRMSSASSTATATVLPGVTADPYVSSVSSSDGENSTHLLAIQNVVAQLSEIGNQLLVGPTTQIGNITITALQPSDLTNLSTLLSNTSNTDLLTHDPSDVTKANPVASPQLTTGVDVRVGSTDEGHFYNFTHLKGTQNGVTEFDMNGVNGFTLDGNGGQGTANYAAMTTGGINFTTDTSDANFQVTAAGTTNGPVDTLVSIQTIGGTAFDDVFQNANTVATTSTTLLDPTFLGSAGNDIYDMDGTSNVLDYSHLSTFDASIQPGSTGVTMAGSGTYDSNGDPIYSIMKGFGGIDGTDTATNVTQFVGSCGDDSFTVDPFETRQLTFFASTGNDAYTGNGSNTNILDYSKLSNFDSNLQIGSTGVIMTPSGTYDAEGDPIYTIVKGADGVDGTDTATNVTDFIGTAENDSFTVDPNQFFFLTFFGSTGNDRYVGNGTSAAILDYSKLSMFDTSLSTSSTGIILNTTGDSDYSIVKGVGGADGTDTVQNFTNCDIVGTIGQDTFNIGNAAVGLHVDGGAGADTFNISGGQNIVINGDDSSSPGEEYSNTLDLSALGGSTFIVNGDDYETDGTSGANGSFSNVDEIVMAGGNNSYSDPQFIPGLTPNHVVVEMGGPNDIGTGNSIERADVVEVLDDGTMLTSGGAEVHDAQTLGFIGEVLTEKLGYSYSLAHIGDLDYSNYDKPIIVSSDPNSSNDLTVTDGQNTDTLDISGGAGWLVGTNNGDTFNLGHTPTLIWLGSGDNTINGTPEASDAFVHNNGNDVFNNLYSDTGTPPVFSDNTIFLAPGITPDEVTVSFTDVTSSTLDMVLTVTGHGSITLNDIAWSLNPDGTLKLSPAPTIEFLGNTVAGDVVSTESIVNFHTGALQSADLQSSVITLPNATVLGDQTVTANAANGYTVIAGSGDNVIQGDATHLNTLIGGTGDDTIIGGNAGDLIEAQFGDDAISTGSGFDQVYCGWGDCTVNLGSGNETVYTQQGDQTINCGSGLATIISGTGNNTIVTGSGGATIYGDLASNTYELSGTGQTTIMDYHSDRDTLEYTNTSVTTQDIVTSRVGNDLVLTNLLDPVTIQGFFDNNTGQTQSLNLSFASLGSLSSPTSAATFTVDATGHTTSVVVNNGGGNHAPVAENGSFTMDENDVLTGNVLANNGNGATTDPDGDTVTAQAGTFATANGATVVVATNGDFTYTPQAEQHGTDSFTFMALDPQGASSIATINVNITPDTPDAKNGSFTLTENGVLTGNVLADNGNGATTDPDGDLVGAQTGTFATAQGGTVEISGNGNFTYTPAAGFHGNDSFTFTALDAEGESGSATITVAVNPDMPVAENGSFTMAENGTLTGNVLADNGFGPASDPDNDLAGVTAGTFTTANGGTLILAANGDFTYTPAHGFSGADSFSYTLFDQEGESATANINIGVTQGVPVVENAGFSVAENAALTGNVLADNGHGAAFDPDGDTLTAQAGTFATANGSVSIAANGDFTYTPNAGFFGADTFSFTALDGFGGAATGTMTVNIAQDLPIAEDGVFTTVHDTVLSGNLLADNGFGAASDPDGDLAGTLAASFTTANGGQVVIHSDGTFTYTPAAGFTGNDTFNYTLLDEDGASANATIQVQVTGSTPVVYNETITTAHGQPVTGNLLANNGSGAAFDPDGDPLHLVGTAALTAEGFQVQLSSNGDFTAAIPAWFVGQDSLNYTVSDPNGDEATATATLDIAAPANAIVGTSGNDNIDDTSNTDHSIFTLQGNDIVQCGGGTDTVYLGPGNDTVFAGTGVDTMIGGGGNDTFNVNNTQDVVIESNQHVADTIISSVSFTLPENVRNLVLTGTGNLTATCNNDGDTVVTNSGVDTVIGGTGDDTIYVNNTSDLVIEHSGHNSVIASVDFRMPANGVESLTFTGSASLTGQGNNLDNTMTANDAGDVLKDGNGNDTIIGGLGDDVLTGGPGTNVIYGGGGNDLITGGNGADTFLFKDATALTGEATIKDFHTGGAHSDVIDISDVIDAVDPSGDNLHNFVQLTHTGSTAFLAINPDGSGWTNIVKIEHGSGLDLDTLIANGNLIV